MKRKSWDTIEKVTPRYLILRHSAEFTFRIFFRKLIVFGKKNIPYGHPIIFAPNHQNAVIDPLAVLNTQKHGIVFLARSDVFKGNFIIKFLTRCKILPVYRKRDGVEKLALNEEIFNVTVRILKQKSAICVMPEGNHGDQNKLRPLVKGIFRIAFTAQSDLKENDKDVMIVPTGLYYEHYEKFDKKLYINYGKPINIGNYLELYNEKPALAINKLKKDLGQKLSETMIDIKSEEYYDSINFISKELTKYIHDESVPHHFFKIKKLTDKFNKSCEENADFLPDLNDSVNKYTELLKKYNLRDWVVIKRDKPIIINIIKALFLLLSSPVFCVGYLLNAVVYHIPNLPIKKIKDRQFFSSVRWAIFNYVTLYYYPLLAIITSFSFKSYIAGIITLITIPVLGVITLKISYLYKKTNAVFRLKNIRKSNPENYNDLITLREKIRIITETVYNS